MSPAPSRSAGPDPGPAETYAQRLQAGILKPDPGQAEAVAALDRLWRELQRWTPPSGPVATAGDGGGSIFRLFRRGPAAEDAPAGPSLPPGLPRGVYLQGPVGRGKSMLMDLFFAAAPVPRRKRVHFNAFMLDIHARIHAWRQTALAQRKDADPILAVAEQVAAEARLLCFDEFQVRDVADAMILGKLFTLLFERGVVMVATSNVLPADLYQDGLQRDRFLPFIALLQDRLDLVRLEGPQDWRRSGLLGEQVWFVQRQPGEATAALHRLFLRLAGGQPAMSATVPVQGRILTVPKAAAGIAAIGFAELCERDRGAVDYLALAARFPTLILSDVPILKPDRLDVIKRLILLIDSLYESRTRLIASAAAGPEGLLTGGDLAFEFQRTVSRLLEMQSAAWLEAADARSGRPAAPAGAVMG